MSETRRNPFPGLRPFLFHEHELFFGREEQYEQMVGKLATTRFLAVVGTSGSGKSSLVRAGLLPALYGGLMMTAGSNWRVALFRPKDDPIREMAQALNHRRVFGANAQGDGTPLLSVGDVVDWPGLCVRLGDEARTTAPSPSSRILELLPLEMRRSILETTKKEDFEQVYKSHFVEAFNTILTRREFYQPQEFEGVTVPGEAQRLLRRGRESLSDTEIQQLNRLLLEASFPQEIANDREIKTRITEVSLRRGDLGLIETVRQAKMPPGTNLLIVVDQFEELFRYARISENGPHGNQAAAFVKLLLEAKSQKEIPIYVVLTMRSDYLGDCAKFWDLPEAINEGQYLTPRLTRDQRREAIVGPVMERGADITPQLVNQLLNDMGDSPDQLPILQHALMRTWDKWEEDHRDNEPIDIRHYDAIGRMAKALSLHADEAYADLPDDRSREIAKRIFKCLTERGARNREIRRPTALREIRSITQAKVKEIVAVIEVFRKEGRSFLMPSPKKPLTRNTSIDISHESLIRNWSKLKDWVQEEARAANTYRRLAETAQLNEKGRASWLSGLEVEYALEWRKNNNPNLAWASRYHPYFNEGFQRVSADGNSEESKNLQDKNIFKSAISFLEESQRKRTEEIESERRKSRAKLTRTRIAAAILLAAAIACIYLYTEANKNAELASKSAELASESAELASESAELTNLIAYNVNIDNAQKAFAEQSYARAYTFLGTLQNDSMYSKMRSFEWDLLNKPSVYDITPVSANGMRHTGAVLASAYLPDKKVLATAGNDEKVRFWNTNTQGGQEESRDITSAVFVVFSLDGNRIATLNGTRKLITVSDAYTGDGKHEWSLQEKESEAQLIALSPDGTKLASILTKKPQVGLKGREELDVWDLTTDKHGPVSVKCASGYASFTAITFSRNGKLAVGCNDGSFGIDGVEAPPRTLSSDKDNPGAQEVSAAGDTSQAKKGIQSLAFSPDQKWLVIGRNNGLITLWELGKSVYSPSWLATRGAILSLAFSSHGDTVAAASNNGSVKLWDMHAVEDAVRLQRGKAVNPSATLKGHAGAVTSVTFLPGASILATTSDDQTVRLWDLSRREVMENRLPAQVANIVALSPEGGEERFAVQFADKAGTLGFVKKTGEGFIPLQGQSHAAPDELTSVATIAAYVPASSVGEKILSTYRIKDGAVSVRLWDIDTLTPLPGKGWTVPVSPASETGTNPQRLVAASKFSPDGKRLATWSPEAGIVFFDIATGNQSEPLLRGRPKENLKAAAFSPDLTVFVESNDYTLRFFDTRTGEPTLRRELKYVDDSVDSMAFSPDGKWFATGHADMTVRVWDTATWEDPEKWNGHNSRVQVMVFSPDGKRLVTGSSDRNIKLWDVSLDTWKNNKRLEGMLKRRELMNLLVDGLDIMTLAFSSDGKMLISGHSDGMIRVVGAN